MMSAREGARLLSRPEPEAAPGAALAFRRVRAAGAAARTGKPIHCKRRAGSAQLCIRFVLGAGAPLPSQSIRPKTEPPPAPSSTTALVARRALPTRPLCARRDHERAPRKHQRGRAAGAMAAAHPAALATGVTAALPAHGISARRAFSEYAARARQSQAAAGTLNRRPRSWDHARHRSCPPLRAV
jgi:hypothetical protein